MSDQERNKYFDLHTTGLGYLNQVREVTLGEGESFLSVTISAPRGSVDKAQYTHLECRVSGKQAGTLVRQLKPAIEEEAKVLVGFTLSDLYVDTFTYQRGAKAGQTGVSLKARLLRIAWVKVDGQMVYSAKEHAA